ncbi:glycosyltransferase involved in cell wall biosynthesis [Mobilisporobacter senegalensis]|uniref:Glycosyltransferase involved in cell wall biosynthesis n=1 Tax=Mobilisporobacter senegalensis TaxID=1329262 RepID=A0A3N1XXW6_9FIRM|nr:glycosyltransferase family 2 protein [Mobilisporobacter senegalensis]ROR31463.1 glycosyltransferase involved in cell wall biosynthesis [Mobilisporobacter senegalensis]
MDTSINNAKIAVLIPCYNESKTIEKVVKDYKNVLPEADIYVYDNNSTDSTDEIARKAGAIVKYEYRQGKGNVIRTMFRDIDADCYLMIDGDDTYPPEYAREMVSLVLDKNVDMVIGDRLSSTYFEENKRAFHNLGNIMVRKLVNLFFKGNITDIMTGYRAFSPIFVKSFPVLSKGFEIETEMTIHALDKNLNLKSIPVTYRDRPDGSVSKLNTYIDGYKVISTIFRLFKDYKPYAFFGTIALFLGVFAGALFIPAFIGFLQTGLVTRIPSVVVSSFMAVGAIQFFMCGLILDTEAKKHRQLFELQVNMMQMIRNSGRFNY